MENIAVEWAQISEWKAHVWAPNIVASLIVWDANGATIDAKT